MSTVNVLGCYEWEGTAVSVPSTIYHAAYLSSRDHVVLDSSTTMSCGVMKIVL
jgi:hypothetical protein